MRNKASLLLALLVLLLSISVTAHAAAPVQNRFNTYYNTDMYNTTDMQYRMNCFGYATRFYYQGDVSWYEPYRQMPGEFAVNTETWSSLYDSYENAMTVWNNLYYFVKDNLYVDYASLGWSITETTSTAQAAAGTRKILFSIKQDGWDSDFHFYVQNSNGTWAHKPGSDPITNLSMDSGTTISNSTILDKAQEGGYDDGTRIFIIGKDSICDYGHNSGQTPSSQYATTDFRDKAGDTITRCTTVSAGNKNCKFDYPGDIDFYKFIPTTTKKYTIKTSCGTGYDVDGDIFDSNGSPIVSDRSTNNASFSVNLTAGVTYYIDFYDYVENVANYTLQIS